MRTIAVVNQKGGVGKTTTVANLTAAIAESSRRVLAIDLDAQKNLTTWYGLDGKGRAILDAMVDDVNMVDLVNPTNVPNVETLPASEWLAAAEKVLAGEIVPESLLRRCIEKLPTDRWDYLIIDCPPSLGILTINALAAVKEVIIPVQSSMMTVDGMVRLFDTINCTFA